MKATIELIIQHFMIMLMYRIFIVVHISWQELATEGAICVE